ncbi:hypothetical protein [Bradyrhizobium sp. SRS-191]|uniref:hypothetical protein n=1 Tax=Bradyrhizobium sp. SRS-191 TaxID=2962606 RepID=UPI00211F1880|nr:hypothetical protein [Bradyrhizobium sp. SRS-191]
MQNFKTEPTDMDQFPGDKTGNRPTASEVVALFKLIPAAAASAGTGPTGAFAGQP